MDFSVTGYQGLHPLATAHYYESLHYGGVHRSTVLSEHLYWQISNLHGPDWAVDYLDSAAYDWTPEEIDFVEWVYNSSPVLKERTEMVTLHKGMMEKAKNRLGNDI